MEIKIRHQEDRDFPHIAEMFEYEDLAENTSQIPYNHCDHWKELFQSRSNESIQLVAEVNGKVAGHLGIRMFSKPRKKHVVTFGISVHPDFQGQGVGSRLVDEMIQLCDNWLNVVRIELGVFTENKQAIALYKKYGFEIEGTSRFDCFRRGQYSSTYQMARIRPDLLEKLP
ncbi:MULTISPECIES: GNAT family N-acetyltransferase [unclassified Endozoicomonas]|uniref:GNAT family N-acetyltransferase n=1 Tax=unclassified Endozoicomonas TaxID=2644528 RepID=UPI0021495EB4|nr:MULTISPECIES: GNAT family N-acetyltransferase [unclassified Endozoicomonas]